MDVVTFLPVAHPHHDGPGFGGFVMFLFWIAILFLVLRFISRGGPPWRGDHASSDRAHDLLSDRFARGDIDAEEFQTRSQTLRDRRWHQPSPVERVRDRFAARSARSILAERFARGEIDAEEYRQRSNELGSS